MKSLPRIIVRAPTIVFAVLLILLDGSALSFLPLAAAIIHECGHLAVMLALGVQVREIEVTLFGAEIRTPALDCGTLGSVAVYGAGAAANIVSAAFAIVFGGGGYEALFFAACSLSLAAVNLLPVRTLDGGCILGAVLVRVCPERAAAVSDAASGVSLVLLWLAAVYILLLFGGNLSLMLFCMYLFAVLYLG